MTVASQLARVWAQYDELLAAGVQTIPQLLLHQAARHRVVAVVEALLDHGASIDMPDAKGHTPLRRAVNCRQVEIVRLLVRRGADRQRADRRGVTPSDAARTDELKQAVERRRVETGGCEECL